MDQAYINTYFDSEPFIEIYRIYKNGFKSNGKKPD